MDVKAHAERERIARWMIANSLATGHGDTVEDLLGEAAGQIRELRAQNAELVAALEELRERILQGKGNVGHVALIDAALAVHPTPSAGNEGSLSTKEGRDDR
jgi:hypothetical protein